MPEPELPEEDRPKQPVSFKSTILHVAVGIAVSGGVYFLPPAVLDTLLNDWPTVDMGLFSLAAAEPTPVALPLSHAHLLRESNGSNPLFYNPVPPSLVYGSLPSRFTQADVEYTSGEVIWLGMNGTIERRFIDFEAGASRDFIYDDDKVKPVVFLITSNGSREERFLGDFDKLTTVIRVPMKSPVRGSSGIALSHVALILSMERFGWPFLCVFEDDAHPAGGWYLLDRIVPLVRELYGETGFVSLDSDLGTGTPRLILPRLLYATRGALTTTGVIWGRRSIEPAHLYLGVLATAQSPRDALVGPGMAAAAAVPNDPDIDVLTWVPARAVVGRYPGLDEDGREVMYDHSAGQKRLEDLEKSIDDATHPYDFFGFVPKS